ncbi:magnesium transporter 4 [Perilla frutescens var. hirtella]|nr:magnesium transporter 4 [Perilla frutescens var. hirtella]KAH6807622.1 magnesium transporter 4 [Perilla frutescens var. frutescens]
MRDVPTPQSAPPPDSGEGVGGEPLIRPTAGGLRKKGAWVRAWLVVDSTGRAEVVEAGKHSIMQRTGLPARDLRILDPALSYPSIVLGRERAIVVNLEHIKSIITSQEMIFQNSKDPLLTPFVQKIQGIFRHRQAVMLSQESGGNGNSEGVWTNFYNTEEPQSMVDGRDQIYTGRFHAKNEDGNADREQHVGDNTHGLKLLPFEFVALETCLDATCSSLDDEARRLEQEAHPALDKLTSKISTLNLDRVRHIKSRLVTITGRVQKVRDELEHLLDDDEDMAEMYLTEKIEEQQLENSSTSSMEELDIIDEEAVQPEEGTRTDVEILMRVERSTVASDINLPKAEQLIRQRSNRSHATSMRSSSIKNLDVEELEMILEAYFVQIEGTLNKLSTLREYVDDTEDYINIMLDDKQNHLLQMGVMLTTATVVVNAFVVLTGVFGMNVGIELFDPEKAGMPDFLWTVGGGTIGCTICYVAAIAWCRYKRLLE